MERMENLNLSERILLLSHNTFTEDMSSPKG
jgi:hypothetical protein